MTCRILALMPLLLIAACTAEAPPAPERAAGEEAQSPAVPALHLPQGEYCIAGADGEDVNFGHAITVSISQDTIAVTSQCVTPEWTYRIEAGGLHTTPVIKPICERGRYPAEEAIVAVFDDPQSLQRTPENGLLVAGGGHDITLFAQ